MTWIDIDEVRTLLRAEAAVLEESNGRLTTLMASVRPSPQEVSDEDLGGALDVPTEIRTVLAMGLQDNLAPLIRKLRAAADYEQPAAAPGPAVKEDRLDL
jgi:hypothetical protein